MWLAKQRNLIDYTLSSLARRRGKNMALAAVYTLVVFVLGSVMLFTHSIKREASLVLNGAPEILVQRLMAGRNEVIPVTYMEPIRKIRGVQSVTGRLWGYYRDPGSGTNFTLVVDQERHSGKGSVLVGKGVPAHFMREEEETLPFKCRDGRMLVLKIKEVISSDSGLISSDLIFISEEDFRSLFGIPAEYVTDLSLNVRNAKELPTIAGKIVQLLPDTRPVLRDEIQRTYDAVFDWRGGLLIVILMGAVAAFIIFAWDKAAGLSAEEKREIGILKGIGWETADVLQMKFWEGVAVSFSSFLMGILLAYVHVSFTPSPLFESVLKGWSVLYPGFRLAPALDAYQVVSLFFFTVIPYTVATIVPSWRAATIDPDLVMRT